MVITAARPPHAEFMRVWEEGYVGTRAMFEAMHMQGIGIFSGGHLRRSDGSLDRARIREWVESATRGIPYAHLRLMRSPLGLTPPAWVPDDMFDLDRHLRFADDAAPLTSASIPRLVGWEEGALDLRRPLWRLQFTALDDGRVALGVLMHHSGGDALRTLKFLAALTTSDPAAQPTTGEDPFAGERAPRRGGELPFLRDARVGGFGLFGRPAVARVLAPIVHAAHPADDRPRAPAASRFSCTPPGADTRSAHRLPHASR